MGIQLVLSPAQLSAVLGSREEGTEGRAVRRSGAYLNQTLFSEAFSREETGPNSNSAIKSYSIIFPHALYPQAGPSQDLMAVSEPLRLLQEPFIYVYTSLRVGKKKIPPKIFLLIWKK